MKLSPGFFSYSGATFLLKNNEMENAKLFFLKINYVSYVSLSVGDI